MTDHFQILSNFVDTSREAAEDEFGASFGDPRRCPRHPGVRTSSGDGMFDGLCGACEFESDMANQAWEVDPSNVHRTLCGTAVTFALSPDTVRHGGGVRCLDELEPDDGICF